MIEHHCFVCTGCRQIDQDIYRCYSFQWQIDYPGRFFCTDLRNGHKRRLCLFDEG